MQFVYIFEINDIVKNFGSKVQEQQQYSGESSKNIIKVPLFSDTISVWFHV